MRNKYVFVLVMLIVVSVLLAGFTKLYLVREEAREDDQETLIVTSFYPMYIAAANIVDGVEGVSLMNLSEPQTGCLHDFTLTPEDMKLLSKADMLVINGGGIENFMTEVAASYPGLGIVDACRDLDLIKDDEEENAHAWMSVKLYRQQVASIAEQLSKVDQKNREKYMANAKIYDEKLAKLMDMQQEVMDEAGPSLDVVLFHEAFYYVAADYGMNVCAVMDLDEERQISAGEVGEIVDVIRENNIQIILAEELYGSDMGNTVMAETEAKVFYIDPLTRGDYDKGSYLNKMTSNISILRGALMGKERQ